MAGSFVAGVRAALPKVASAAPTERAAGCASVTDLLVNSNGRELAMVEVVLPALLQLVPGDPVAMVPLATAAQGLWGSFAYPEALRCLDVTIPYVAPTEAALSSYDRPWDDWSIPYTRARELALNRLWRFESLLAVGRIDEALADEAGAIAGSDVLPVPFKLSANIHEWGDAGAFTVRARIRAARALRRRAEGRDANAFRKVRKADQPKPAEATRLRAQAGAVIAQTFGALDASLADYAPFPPGKALTVGVEEKRRLAGWRAEGYAEAGLTARDAGTSCAQPGCSQPLTGFSRSSILACASSSPSTEMPSMRWRPGRS